MNTGSEIGSINPVYSDESLSILAVYVSYILTGFVEYWKYFGSIGGEYCQNTGSILHRICGDKNIKIRY